MNERPLISHGLISQGLPTLNFRGRPIKSLLRTLIIVPLTTGQVPGSGPDISPAAKRLLTGNNKNMFTVGSGHNEVRDKATCPGKLSCCQMLMIGHLRVA